MATDREEFALIREALKKNPRGMNVIEIAAAIDMHRQSVTKYLEMLVISGQVEMRTFGPAKVYYLSQRLPLSAMLSISSDMILLLDRDLRIINANDAFLSRMNAAREEILNKVIGSEYFPLEFQPSIIPYIADAILGKESRIEAVYKKRGREQFFDVKLLPVVFDDGQPGATVILEDVTGQRRAEQERETILARLKESDQQFRSLLQNLRSGVVLVEADGRFSIYNPAYLQIFGFTDQDMQSLNIDSPEWSSIESFDKDGNPLPVEERPSIKAFRTGSPVKNMLVGFRRRTDTRITWALVNAEPQKTHDGRVDKLICTYYDITDRKLAEEALRENERRLQKAQEIAHLGSWELDLVNGTLTWSDEVFRIFGLQPRQFKATYADFLEVVHPDDRKAVDAAYTVSISEGRDTYEIVHRIVRKSTGEVRFVHEKCEHYRDASGRIVRSVGMVHDITERKRMEDALKDREEYLKLRLNALLAPEGDICEKTLEEVLDLPALQESIDSLYDATGIGIWILGLDGKILAGKGWQDICAKFHRCHPEASRNCIESDLCLAGKPLAEGEYAVHRCKNGLWDLRTPIIICGKHMANLNSGQFFYDDEEIDRAFFERQAEKYGFDKEEYLAALDRVPRVGRDKVLKTIGFYMKFARMIAMQSYSNARLAKALIEKK
ncbi:PocR ligand-binding domain-containing protein [Methanocella sp. MCL-LM]|uniref:PocR ligand-binding domain-containing protein n=1 Tax=Methanocella sp. MCL-LM TaxID=3412035 RepID=UPI003C75BDCB